MYKRVYVRPFPGGNGTFTEIGDSEKGIADYVHEFSAAHDVVEWVDVRIETWHLDSAVPTQSLEKRLYVASGQVKFKISDGKIVEYPVTLVGGRRISTHPFPVDNECGEVFIGPSGSSKKLGFVHAQNKGFVRITGAQLIEY